MSDILVNEIDFGSIYVGVFMWTIHVYLSFTVFFLPVVLFIIYETYLKELFMWLLVRYLYDHNKTVQRYEGRPRP